MSRWIYVESLEDENGVTFRHLIVDAIDEDEAFSKGVALIGPCPPSVKLNNHVIKFDGRGDANDTGRRAVG
ncbi:MAG: hypothetical protein IH984_04615 [Planctomycetes bacterium]|nr:hypothetical protein [Planctomycetota bacterium]